MKTFPSRYLFPVALAMGALTGCSSLSTEAAEVAPAIRVSLDQAGYKEVTVAHNREKGVVTLSGHVSSDAAKVQAALLAQGHAANQVVANEIAVLPLGDETDAKRMNLALDEGIESNLHAALINANLSESVKHTVKNHVVTLTGEVDSQAKRARAEAVAAGVPNVQQVVNELQVKGQKATTTQ